MRKFGLIWLLLIFVSSNLFSEEIIWKKNLKHLGEVNEAVLSQQPEIIAYGIETYIHVRNIDTDTYIQLDGHSEKVTALKFHNAVEKLYSGSGSFDNLDNIASIIEWDIEEGSINGVFEPSPEVINNFFFVKDIELSNDNSVLAALILSKNQTDNMYDFAIMFWNTETYELLAQVEFSGTKQINKIQFSDGKLYFNEFNKISYIDLSDYSTNCDFSSEDDYHHIAISDFDISGDLMKFVSVDVEGICKIWDITSSKVTNTFFLKDNNTVLDIILFGKDDDYLVYADNTDINMSIYKLSDQELIHSFIDCESQLVSMDLNSTKDKLLISDGENLFYINLTYQKTISVENYYNLSNFGIYPNPVVSELIISDANNYFSEIEIYNLIGERINNIIITNKNSIDLSFLIKGYYFVVFKGQMHQTTRILYKD